MGLSIDDVVERSADQVSLEVIGEAAILHLKSGRYFKLDPMGAFIWMQIAHPKAVHLIRDAIIEEYDVPQERCEQDVLAFLSQLMEQGLIRSTGAG